MKTTKIITLGLAIAFASVSLSGTAMAGSAIKKCKMCHSLEKDGGTKPGPSLYGVIGRTSGTLQSYLDRSKKYKAFKKTENQFVWTEELIAEWITDQKKFMKAHKDGIMKGVKKTKMNVKIKKEKDRNAIIEILSKHKYSAG
ncbi:MAG: hypothetical protein JKY92_00600 [Magnetovibrio sp.]|nr:hypothetical protein [Magnetovibrio sp.]